jgi:hypothetical protein
MGTGASSGGALLETPGAVAGGFIGDQIVREKVGDWAGKAPCCTPELLGGFPIHHVQAWDSGKLLDVVGHQCGAAAQGCPGDE